MTSPPPLEFFNAAPGRKKFTVGVAAVAPRTIWHARPGVVAAPAERLVRWWGAASAIHFFIFKFISSLWKSIFRGRVALEVIPENGFSRDGHVTHVYK